MKTTIRNIKTIIVLTFSFLIIPKEECSAQNNFDISAGFGILEMLNIGVNYQINDKTQAGIKIGGLPFKKNESVFSISGNYSYHFAGESKLSDRPLWFGKIGLNYFRDETENTILKYLFLDLRIGREVNFTEKIGASIDAGFDIQMKHFEKVKIQTSGGEINMNMPFIPCFGISIFYRL